MSDERKDGGPAFPSKMTANDQSVSLQDTPERHLGMTLRDYFIAHAPAEPQEWFEPVMPPCPAKPLMPQAGEQGERDYVREFDLVMDPQEITNPELRAYVVAIQAYQQLAAVWRQEAAKRRYLQWPAAWADAMLKARQS